MDSGEVMVSPNVLKMQFMKRTALKIEGAKKKVVKQEGNDRVYSTVQLISDEPTCSVGGIFNEERFTVLEDLRFGRFSFNGQNQDIEKLMVYHECKRKGLEPPSETIEVKPEDFEEGEVFEDEDIAGNIEAIAKMKNNGRGSYGKKRPPSSGRNDRKKRKRK